VSDLGGDWPDHLELNAWTRHGPVSGTSAALVQWAFRPQGEAVSRFLKPDTPVPHEQWDRPEVGWGVVLPHRPERSLRDLARAEDAPEPIRRLLCERPGAPVLRYDEHSRLTHLLRPTALGELETVGLSGAPRGTGPRALPRYLLIYGTPAEIPWELQYLLNQAAAVGRLTLTGEALERYVDHLLADWRGAPASPHATLVWASYDGGDRMLTAMRDTVAKPLHDAFASDSDLDAAFLDGAAEVATGAKLVDALAARRPGVVVTTSHGLLPSPGDADGGAAALGVPVGQDGQPLDLESLLSAWSPGGAIWYAHACCSAGSDKGDAYDGLFKGSELEEPFAALRAAGPATAALPEALLAADPPRRAFVGHVQPTFDWSIRHPATGQTLTTTLREALYDRLFQPWPLGHSLGPCYGHVGELFAARDQAYQDFNQGKSTAGAALAFQLAALDRQSMVILGDPTVALPDVGG
jgi:hypothetical protein